MQFWLGISKLLAGVATPVAVTILGIILLRRIEGVKAIVAKQSDFQKKWAEEFFSCCQEFMRVLERDLALLTFIGGLQNPNDDFGTELQKEISRLNPKLSELELCIRRSVVFAPHSGNEVTEAAKECLSLTCQLINSLKGDLDKIIESMNKFNRASRRAHAEMLEI